MTLQHLIDFYTYKKHYENKNNDKIYVKNNGILNVVLVCQLYTLFDFIFRNVGLNRTISGYLRHDLNVILTYVLESPFS